MPDAVRVERAGPVATVILDRPAVRNAVDPATAADLATAFTTLNAEAATHAIVFWGAGERSARAPTCRPSRKAGSRRDSGRPTARRTTRSVRWARRAWNSTSP